MVLLNLLLSLCQSSYSFDLFYGPSIYYMFVTFCIFIPAFVKCRVSPSMQNAILHPAHVSYPVQTFLAHDCSLPLKELTQIVTAVGLRSHTVS